MTKASGANAAPRTSSSRSSAKGGSSTATTARGKGQKPVVPETPGIARIIAIANQKGGVGKSTTAVSLGAALADLGFRVLVVDLDPQGNASTGMGIKHEAREITVYDVIVAEAPVEDAIVQTLVPRLHAVPSTIDLAGAEIELVSQFSRETRLKKALVAVREGMYDFILMDCPPSLGLLTINALTAAEELIVPIQCEYYALEGVGQLLRNVSLVQKNINQDLRLSGIVMTMFDPRTKLSEQVVEEVQRYFGDLVYDTIIPRTVRLSEAPGFGQPITVYDPKSKGAECYRELARAVALRPPPAEPMPSFDDLPTVVLPAIDPSPPVASSTPIDEADPAEAPTVHGVVEEEAEDIAQSRPDPGSEPVVELRSEAAVEPRSEPAPEPRAQAAPDDQRATAEADDEDELWEEADAPRQTTSRVTSPRSPDPPGHLPERRVVVIDEDADMATAQPSRPQASKPPPRLISPEEPNPSQAEQHPAVADIGATLEDEDDAPKRRWRLFRKGGV